MGHARLLSLDQVVGELTTADLENRVRLRRPRFVEPEIDGGGRVVITLGRVKD